MKNNILLSAVVAVLCTFGLMAGAIMAPAQAEEQEPLPVLPCVDFTTDFNSGLSSPAGDVVEQTSEGSTFTGLIEIADSDFPTQGFRTELPTLRIGVPETTELVPSVFDGSPPVLGCDYYNPIQIAYTWLSRSDGFEATVDQGTAVSTPSWDCKKGADGCRQMSMRQVAISKSWIEVSPKIVVSEYGQYVNVADFSMAFDPDWTTQKQAKTTQVSYTVTVVPPTKGNQLPSIPDEPAGISDGYDFGNVKIFDYKRGVVEITNIGEKDLAVRKAKIVDSNGDEAPEFSVTGTTCKDGFIKPKRSCQVQVQFFPRVEGSRAAFINVTTNGDYPLQIPLTGVGTYTKPESVVEAEKEAEANGTEPVYGVSEPEKVQIANSTTEAGAKGKSSQSVVKAKKKKIKVKWKTPDTDQPVTGYEIRSKFKKKSWKGWKAVDPMPNKKGWIKASVKAKRSGNYKIQVTSSTPWVERGDKATVKIKKK